MTAWHRAGRRSPCAGSAAGAATGRDQALDFAQFGGMVMDVLDRPARAGLDLRIVEDKPDQLFDDGRFGQFDIRIQVTQ